VEVWRQGELIGGLYGVSIGRMFFGESMFSRATDASKLALVHLLRQLRDWEFPLVDCQVTSTHLLSLGAQEMSRTPFREASRRAQQQPGPAVWQFAAAHAGNPAHLPA